MTTTQADPPTVTRQSCPPPTLSVTVTNYNYGRYLGQNIESILGQSFDDFELILIDNASTDDSLDVMRRYAATDARIRIVAHERNKGMFASLHESCALSRGRYRVPIEADDWVTSRHAFELQVDVLERHPAVSFVYPSLTMTMDDGEAIVVSRPFPSDTLLPGEGALEAILSFSLTHTGMMMRLDALRATEGYPEEYPHIADMLLGVRLAEVGDVAYLNRSLYAFRQHGSNLHLNPPLGMVRREVLPAIDTALEGPLGARLDDPRAFRRRVTRRALVHLPTQYVFAGEKKLGWRLYWESCKEAPATTILQPRTMSLLSRTILGAHGHDWITRQLGRRRSSDAAPAPVGRADRTPPSPATRPASPSRTIGSNLMRRSGLRKGDRVIVRSAGEILATLDETGARDGMPFMPEMVELCGRRYTVDRRAEKICDTITNDLRSRRLANTVLLEDLRCDGGGHGGCQAECRLYWHEAWLRREEDDGAPTEPAPVDDEATRALLDRVSRGARSNGDGNARYRCQATEMFTASLPLSTADPRSYARELSSGNVPLGKFVHVMARATVMQTLYHLDKLPMPPLKGDSATSPPSTPLDLRPGDWVRVKSKEEIRKMLTEKGANRGLWFDREMVAFCGRVMQVRGRVTRIVDERTGEMIELARDCIKLEGGVCSGEFSTGRWFCPREIYSYWRECWLERIDAPAVLPPADHASTTDASAPLNG